MSFCPKSPSRWKKSLSGTRGGFLRSPRWRVSFTDCFAASSDSLRLQWLCDALIKFCNKLSHHILEFLRKGFANHTLKWISTARYCAKIKTNSWINRFTHYIALRSHRPQTHLKQQQQQQEIDNLLLYSELLFPSLSLCCHSFSNFQVSTDKLKLLCDVIMKILNTCSH